MEEKKEELKEENMKEKKEEVKKDKSNNKLIFIIIGIILILALLVFGIFYIIPKISGPKEMPDWGNKYYNYLKNFSQTSKETLKENNVEIAETYSAGIYEYDDGVPPVLALDPVEPENKYLLLVVLVDGEPKEFVIDKEDARVEMLYNVAEKEYYYYFMYQENGSTHFIKLADYLSSLLSGKENYTETVVKNGETITVDGKEVLKVDTLFLEPEVPEIVMEYKPEEVKDLEKNLSYFITDVNKSVHKMTDTKENGLGLRIEEINKIIVTLESQKTEEPAPNPEQPSEPEQPSNPEPDPHQCEYDYLTWIYDGCYDLGQLVRPGSCDYGYTEQDGICFSFECDGLPETGIDPNCSDQYPKPGYDECAPGLSLHEGYCFRH